jgi:hypothetical protein
VQHISTWMVLVRVVHYNIITYPLTGPLQPVFVWCEMNENTYGVTVVDNNLHNQTVLRNGEVIKEGVELEVSYR